MREAMTRSRIEITTPDTRHGHKIFKQLLLTQLFSIIILYIVYIIHIVYFGLFVKRPTAVSEVWLTEFR